MKHVYCVPGLAASTRIFEYIVLPPAQFQLHFLPWQLPLPNETLKAYSKRFTKNIVHENPIVIGVSFGGLVAQEIAKCIAVDKIIIISSVKSTGELPIAIRLSKWLKLHRLLPTFLIEHMDLVFKYNLGIGQKKLERYSRYLEVRDKDYLNWSLRCVVHWDRTVADPRVIHIHGEDDSIFPLKNIKKCIIIPGASHAAIITHAKWLNERLPEILDPRV